MAIAVSFVRKVTGSGVTSVTTAAEACGAGDTLNAWSTADQSVTINKPTDTAGNDYGTPVATVNTGGSSSKQAAYVKENAAGHASNQLTFTYGGSTYPTVYFTGVTGAAAASFDAGSLASGASSAGSPFNRNTLGQAQASNLVLAYVATDAGGTLTYTNTGFIVSQEQDGNNFWTGAVGYRTVNQTTPVTSSFAVAPGASNGGTITYALKEDAGGGGASITGAGGITSGEVIGAPVISAGVAAAGIASAGVIGSPIVGAGVSAGSVGSQEAVGSLVIGARVAPAGIASDEGFGGVALGASVSAGGIATSEVTGLPLVGAAVAPLGLASGEASGAPAIGAAIAAEGITSSETPGTPALSASISAAAITSAEAFGLPVINGQGVAAAGIESAEAIGSPGIAARLDSTGISSAAALGAPSIAAGIVIAAIPSSELVGQPAIGGGAAEQILCLGIPSVETFGTPRVGDYFFVRTKRTLAVLEEDRAFEVPDEDRGYRLPPENRTYGVRP